MMSWSGYIQVSVSPATDTGEGVEWVNFVVRTQSTVSASEAKRGAQILSNLLIEANNHSVTPVRRELYAISEHNFETTKVVHAAGSRFSIMKEKNPDHDSTRKGGAQKLKIDVAAPSIDSIGSIGSIAEVSKKD